VTEHLLQICVNGARYSLVPTSQWAADSAHLLLRAGERVDWDRLVAVAVERRLILPVRDALAYLREKLQMPVSSSAIERLNAARVFDVERLEHEANMIHPLQHNAAQHDAREHMGRARHAERTELEHALSRIGPSFSSAPPAVAAPPVVAVKTPSHAAAAPAPARRRTGPRCVSGWRPSARKS
jgi:hypothetical protein